MLVVQVVEILWTKATRGAPRSNERVSLPRAFPITDESSDCIIQRHRILESEAFAPRLVKLERFASPPGSVDALQVVPLADGAFSLGVYGTPYSGQPKRRPLLNAIKLKSGQSARLVINARHTHYSGQHYSETVYNVACGNSVAPAQFLTPPDQELDLKADLF
jgi:hypothetical protein